MQLAKMRADVGESITSFDTATNHAAIVYLSRARTREVIRWPEGSNVASAEVLIAWFVNAGNEISTRGTAAHHCHLQSEHISHALLCMIRLNARIQFQKIHNPFVGSMMEFVMMYG